MCIRDRDQIDALIQGNLSKATLYNGDEATEITEPNEAALLYKSIKKLIKSSTKIARQLSSERLNKEKLKAIGTVEITSSHIIFGVSLFTSLFLVSGFLYTKFLYGSFGLNVGDFFTASDYISSSVDVLIPVFLSTALGILGMLWGLNESIYNELRIEQFKICLLYTSPSPRDLSTSRMPSSA